MVKEGQDCSLALFFLDNPYLNNLEGVYLFWMQPCLEDSPQTNPRFFIHYLMKIRIPEHKSHIHPVSLDKEQVFWLQKKSEVPEQLQILLRNPPVVEKVVPEGIVVDSSVCGCLLPES